MPNNYKDFSQYNEAAEDIRPGSRIQLIQRILNASNLISSLAAGVPMKWANAYKSFQVLVPNENGAPTDYTTDNAVSAVDSILHEAEAQLRSSNDDMNTLTSELEKMELSGSIDNLSSSINVGMKYAAIYLTGSGDTTKYVVCHFDGLSHLDAVSYMNIPDWQAIPSDQKFSFFSEKIMYYEERSNSDFNAAISRRMVQFYDHRGYVHLIVFRHCTNTTIPLFEIMDIYREFGVVGNANKIGFKLDHSSVPDPFVTTAFQPLTNTPTTEWNGFSVTDSTPVKGYIDSQIALGLADPTEVINILDNMV